MDMTEINRLQRQVKERDETIGRWVECGNAIMREVVGRDAPLSDSDVVGFIADLKSTLHYYGSGHADGGARARGVLDHCP